MGGVSRRQSVHNSDELLFHFFGHKHACGGWMDRHHFKSQLSHVVKKILALLPISGNVFGRVRVCGWCPKTPGRIW